MARCATEEEVRQALDEVLDPCSQAAGTPLGIVSMGLVSRIDVHSTDDGSDVALAIGVTDPICFMAAPFMAAARSRLQALPGVRRVELRIDAQLDWTEDRMSPEARARLEAARAVRRGTLPVLPPGRAPARGGG